jgi:hypothetical protein
MDEHDRLRRIRLVSHRYYELQGLRGALVGTAFTLSMGWYLVATGWKEGVIHPGFALALAFAIMIPGMLWLDRYYATTFGRVKPDAAVQRLGTVVIPIGAGVATIVDNWVLNSSGAGLFLALGAFWLWVAIRDWPLRGYILVEVIAAFVAGAVQLTGAARQAPDSALAAGFLLIGVAEVMTGFADHRLLTRFFTLAHSEKVPELPHGDESQS